MLLSSETYMRACFDGAPEAIVIHKGGAIIDANRAAALLLGEDSAQALTGRPFLDLVSPDQKGRAEAWLQDLQTAAGATEPFTTVIEPLEKRPVAVEVRSSLLYLTEGDLVRSILRDITASNEAEQELARQRALAKRLSMVVEHTTNGVVITDLQMRAEWVNAAFEQMTGFSAAEIIGRTPEEVFRQTEQPTGDALTAEQAHREVPLGGDFPLPSKDGSLRHVRVDVQPLFDDTGAQSGFLTILIDLTDRHEATDALEKSERRHRALVAGIPDLIMRIDRKGTYLDVHAPDPSLLVQSREALLGRRIHDVFEKGLADRYIDAIEAALRTGETQQLNYAIKPQGTSTFFEARLSPVADDEVLIVIRDYTSRVDAESALRKSEDRARLLSENTREVVYLYRLYPEEGLEYISPSIATLTGYAPEVFYSDQKLSSRLVHPEDLPISDRLKKLDGATTATLRWVAQDGSILHVEQQLTPVYDVDGRLVAVEGIARDVTARVEAEQAASDADDRYRRLVENAITGIYLIDHNRFTYVNPRFAELFGYTQEEILALPDATLLTVEEDRPEMRETIRRRVVGEMDEAKYALRGIRKDGSILHLEIHGRIYNEGGRRIVQGMVLDVTERVEREAQMRLLQAAISQTRDGVMITEAVPGGEPRIVYVNRASEEMVGYAPGEMLGRSPEILRGRQTNADLIQSMKEDVEGGQSFTGETRIYRKDGSSFYQYCSVAPLLGEDGDPTHFIAIQRDMTEARQSRDALQESEAFLDSIIENLPVQVFVKEAETLRFIRFNKAAEEQLGHDRSEMLGKHDSDIFPKEEADHFTKIDREVLSGRGVTVVEEEVITTPHRGLCTLRTKKIPIFGKDGQPRFLLGISEDVTEQKEALEKIRASEARYHALSKLQLSYGFSYLVDAGGARTIEWVTDSMKAVFGYEPEEMLRKDWFTLIHPDDAEAYATYGKRLLEGRTAAAEFRARRKDGVYRWMAAIGVPEWDEAQSRVVRVNGSGQDITETKQAQLELLAAKEEAEQASRLKDTFLANMSHEIRTPLTSILGFADVLQDLVESDAGEFVHYIRKGGQRLMDTLNSVLDLAQLRGGAMHLQPEPFAILPEVQNAVDLFEEQARQQNLTLSISSPADESLRVQADRAALGRVLNNLLSNAIKFTREGNITVRVKSKGSRVQVTVEDTGVGISEVFLPHLFEEFRQESSGYARSHEGNGLGLTITKELIELMGGEISVRSRKGEGSAFSILLPGAEGSPAVEKERPETVEADHEGRVARILALDDNPNVGLLLRRFLEPSHQVDTVLEPAAAFEMASRERYDLVLLDINLRDLLTGEDVLRSLRALPSYAKVPIVALTAYALPGDEERYLAGGFDGYIGKPFSREHLQTVVSRLLAAEEMRARG